MSKPYTYTFIRKDISLEQQLVQLAHATLEAGFRFEKPIETSFLILLEVQDQDELIVASKILEDSDIDFHMFYEPDNDMKFSAICTRPVYGNRERKLFRQWKLYTAVS